MCDLWFWLCTSQCAAPPPPLRADPGDSDRNNICLSESPHWVRKALSDPVGGVTYFMLYSILRMPQGHWEGLKLSVRVPWVGGQKSVRIPLGARKGGGWGCTMTGALLAVQERTLLIFVQTLGKNKQKVSGRWYHLSNPYVYTYTLALGYYDQICYHTSNGGLLATRTLR